MLPKSDHPLFVYYMYKILYVSKDITGPTMCKIGYHAFPSLAGVLNYLRQVFFSFFLQLYFVVMAKIQEYVELSHVWYCLSEHKIFMILIDYNVQLLIIAPNQKYINNIFRINLIMIYLLKAQFVHTTYLPEHMSPISLTMFKQLDLLA